jgi:hypothetical protein
MMGETCTPSPSTGEGYAALAALPLRRSWVRVTAPAINRSRHSLTLPAFGWAPPSPEMGEG